MERLTMLLCILVATVFILIPFHLARNGNQHMKLQLQFRYESKHMLFYTIIILTQIIRQILNNIYWQASRDAMKVPPPERGKYMLKITVLSVLTFVLWVVSIMFIATKDMVTILCLFVGRILSEWIVLGMIKQDQNTNFRITAQQTLVPEVARRAK